MKPSEIALEISDFAAFCLGDAMRHKVTCYDYRAKNDFRQAIIELQTWNRATMLDYLSDIGYEDHFSKLWDFSRDQALTLILEHISDIGPFQFLDYAREE